MKKIILLISLLIIQVQYANGQLQNGDFEDVVVDTDIIGQNYLRPLNWNFYNGSTGTEITNDSYSGEYAVKLWSWYFGQENMKFYYGEEFMQGVEFEERPNKLVGYYKYENVNIENGIEDSAVVEIVLTKYDEFSNNRDTISYTTKNLESTNNYREFEVELNYQSQNIPDTLNINFKSSLFEYVNVPQESNFLYLDNLKFTSITNVINQEKEMVKIFPNPTKNKLSMTSQFEVKGLKIYSMDGKLLKNWESIKNGRIQIDLKEFESGVYLIELYNSENKKVVRKKIVKMK